MNLALRDGVSAKVLRAVLDDQPDQLPADLADIFRFTQAAVSASAGEGQLRERLRNRFGEEGLLELALAIASCRVFPITKRALGYARSCSVFPIRLENGLPRELDYTQNSYSSPAPGV